MKEYYIGLDFGGTNLKAGLVFQKTGEVSHLSSLPTASHQGPQGVMESMAILIENIIDQVGRDKLGGIGIGVPGIVDLDNGITKFLPNLPGNWPDIPLGPTIQTMTGLPVHLLNDVRAITYGEWQFGAGQGSESMACFAIGTGIGGGLVINNQLVLGIGGTAGELGHITVDYNGPICGCGNRGCVETLASGPAIAAMGIKAVTQGLTTSIGQLAEYDLNKITPELISQAALDGDARALEIYREAGFYLGIAVANVLVSVGTKKVVFAGGVAQAGNLLLDPIKKTINERVKMMPVEQVEIVPAKLGSHAGIIGVAMWASHRIS
ncbi:MAG TPA: ROK family protein [Anaerolineaceae bacterium]|nr:ROK family protein [Anaerolineaceae bacterium]